MSSPRVFTGSARGGRGLRAGPADTIWMGVVDAAGRAVSMIQSLYHEFGSGVVLEETGITWQNRGSSFSLDPAALNSLRPGRKPFHTLNPALARLKDGRVMVYGTMGGDAQPQAQAAVFTRIVTFGMDPQAAVAAPRWVYGRTWGQAEQHAQAGVALRRRRLRGARAARARDRAATRL